VTDSVVERLTERVTIRLTPSELATVRAAAGRWDRDLAGFVREATVGTARYVSEMEAERAGTKR
jgi:uncharacterized protein (DUF1778 family)